MFSTTTHYLNLSTFTLQLFAAKINVDEVKARIPYYQSFMPFCNNLEELSDCYSKRDLEGAEHLLESAKLRISNDPIEKICIKQLVCAKNFGYKVLIEKGNLNFDKSQFQTYMIKENVMNKLIAREK